MRIQKYMAQCGVASRRASEAMIAERRVTVNGKTAEIGQRIQDGDIVLVDGREIARSERLVYIAYYKPAGELSSASDDRGRRTVLDRFADLGERIYPVGRLDLETEGLLLLTNDGDFMQRIAHPSGNITKTYTAKISGRCTPDMAKQLRRGVILDGRKTHPAQIEVLNSDDEGDVLKISIHEGRNRQVRRMLLAIGTRALYLRRDSIGSITLGGMKKGQWRELTQKEIQSFYK